MRGGIPFPLTVIGMHDNDTELFENEALLDALKRYKSISGKDDFDISKTEPFFQAVKTLNVEKSMRITLQENAIKVRFKFKNEDYVLDYNFKEPESVFILSRRSGKLFVKDCNLNEIHETLGRF
jgi:hypothetical protein